MNKIKKVCRLIATAGVLSRFPFGGIVFSTVGALFMFVVQSMFHLQTTALLSIVFGVAVLLVIIMQIATMGSGEELFNRNAIVLDKIIGMFCAFLLVPAKLKILIFGFVLFHCISFGQQFVQFRGYAARLSGLPGVLGIISDDIVAGVLVNGFLHLMIWIVH